MKTHAGDCLCGAVRYEVDGDPIHCENCQRLSGAGHTIGAVYPKSRFRIAGTVQEYRLASYTESEVTRVFCPTCSSPIYGKNTRIPDFVTITLGTLDGSATFSAQVAIFTRNKKPWDVMDESLPSFSTQPKWKPEDCS